MKCGECGERKGSNAADCEVCWEHAMDEHDTKVEAARDRETDRLIDEARGK